MICTRRFQPKPHHGPFARLLLVSLFALAVRLAASRTSEKRANIFWTSRNLAAVRRQPTRPIVTTEAPPPPPPLRCEMNPMKYVASSWV